MSPDPQVIPAPPQGPDRDAAPARPNAASGQPELRIGEVLTREGVITEEQLKKALRIQSRMEERKPLGNVLVELGWITRARLDEVMRKARRKLSIEQILVSRGALRAEQLAAAIEALKDQPNVNPARHLLDIGAISERVYLEAYCEKHDVPYVDITATLVDRKLLEKVSVKYLSRQRLVPLSVQEGRLNVAMERLDDRAITELQRLYGMPLNVFIAESAKITATLAELESELAALAGGQRRAVEYRVVAEITDENRNAAEIVDGMLRRGLREGASDIHFDPDRLQLRVRFRIDGQLVRAAEYPAVYTPAVISRLKVLAGADIAERRAHQQGRILMKVDGEDIDVRASFYVTVAGENAVLRLLRKANVLVGLEELGFSPATLKMFVQDVLEPSSGTLLVTGPTGSGKTTTLYAAVQRLLDDTKKVITCEDPVEYRIEGVTQCSVADRPGMSYPDSLRAILRQDPDVILIGEIRDHESAGIAINCALTGHKVLTTLHTEESVGALIRLLQMDIEPFLVASTVTAVVAQRLLRRHCQHCRVEYSPTASEIRALSLPREELPSFTTTRSRGCPSCHYTGYKGRIGVYELLVLNDALRDAILNKRPTHEIRRLAQEAPGFMSLQEDGIAKALRGQTTLAEVIANCPRRPSIRRLRQLVETYS